jgi:2-methylcitrate dehydratase PrpD
MNESRALADYAAGLTYDALPSEVVEKAKRLILDQIGIMIGISTMPWSRAINEYIRDWGDSKPESTVAHYGYKAKAENAAFANSCFGHGFEVDDIYVYGSAHPGCIVVPAAFAIGEKEHISGKEMILATVAGYEVMGRINAAIVPSCGLRGFHQATSVTGPFGAATATAKILGFDQDLTLHALALAGSHSAGVAEYDQTGGSVKRMHAGMASQGGIRSALLAQKGITGPSAILEGKHGVLVAFTDSYRVNEITDNLGSDFRVTMGTGFKAYFACAGIHSAIDALLQIKQEQDIQADDVAEIIMGTNRRTISHVDAEAKDILSSQFSAPFTLALTLLRGTNGFNDYTEETLRDETIRKVAAKVRLEVDKEVDSEYPGNRSALVTVRLKNGASHSAKVRHCKGTPQNPLSDAEHDEKFRALALVNAKPDRVQEILRIILDLENQKDLVGLAALLSSAHSARVAA